MVRLFLLIAVSLVATGCRAPLPRSLSQLSMNPNQQAIIPPPGTGQLGMPGNSYYQPPAAGVQVPGARTGMQPVPSLSSPSDVRSANRDGDDWESASRPPVNRGAQRQRELDRRLVATNQTIRTTEPTTPNRLPPNQNLAWEPPFRSRGYDSYQPASTANGTTRIPLSDSLRSVAGGATPSFPQQPQPLSLNSVPPSYVGVANPAYAAPAYPVAPPLVAGVASAVTTPVVMPYTSPVGTVSPVRPSIVRSSVPVVSDVAVYSAPEYVPESVYNAPVVSYDDGSYVAPSYVESYDDGYRTANSYGDSYSNGWQPRSQLR